MSEASGRLIEMRAIVRMMAWEGPREQSPSREKCVQAEEGPNGLGGGPETRARGPGPAGRAPRPCDSGVDRVTSTRPTGTIPSAGSTVRRRLVAAPRSRRSTSRIPEVVAQFGFVRRLLVVECSLWIGLYRGEIIIN